MTEQQLREQLYAAFKHRAMLYYLIFDEMRKELGEDKAAEILKRAIYRRGVTVGRSFAKYAPNDLDGLRGAFLDGIPDNGQMFAAKVQRCDDRALDIHLTNCPLKDALEEAGVNERDVAAVCRIAAEIDAGTFEGAGFCFSADTWQPGEEGCCHLHIRPGKRNS